jgi:hypothetical protein
MKFLLVLIIYVAGPSPVVTTVMQDFDSGPLCEQVAETIQALARTRLHTGADVVWRCIKLTETAVG